MPQIFIYPPKLIGFAGDSELRSKKLLLVAGANITFTPVQTGDAITLTIESTGGGGSGLTQPQVLARLSMGF